MQLKVTMDYAVRTLMYLARNKGIVPIAEIEEAMKKIGRASCRERV